ncbi:acyl carrier protein [Variovorax sp. N23]|uniref:acyl carrier protein n=1 Tax=Variovorax sp. N23 TaxID=2980555 RepID=UPI0021CA6D30|nr:acyl carrier protein [Variovorax sp. N23]MCU4119452.1 acyl carrier protein [Variovorax sp. N23]
MPSPVYNSIAAILEGDFKISPGQIRPDTTLVDLGLDSLALMEFVFAVEDAFRLRIPEDRLDPREAGLTLAQLCDVVEDMQDGPATAIAPLATHA